MTDLKDLKGNRITAALLLILGGIVGFFAGGAFLGQRRAEPLYPSEGLTRQRLLSDYFGGLKGRPGDTDVFIYEGDEPGGSVLVVGGTHPNEPAGFVTAVLLAENMRVRKGKVVVVPRANVSGFTCTDPQEGSPMRFRVETPEGGRTFRFGSRLTNPVHQWPDPTLYENPANQILSGAEIRNLNRCYPGRKDGYLTERIAFGIMELIRKEAIDVGIDLHESSPEYPVINAIVFHEYGADVAAIAQMNLQGEGLDLRLESSPPNLRGLSHREWGDAAGIKAILLETPNPSQGRLRGRTTASLVVDGKDRDYLMAASLGRLFIPYTEEGVPLDVRVARHIAGVQAILGGLAEMEPDKTVTMDGLPAWPLIIDRGVGYFLGVGPR